MPHPPGCPDRSAPRRHHVQCPRSPRGTPSSYVCCMASVPAGSPTRPPAPDSPITVRRYVCKATHCNEPGLSRPSDRQNAVPPAQESPLATFHSRLTIASACPYITLYPSITGRCLQPTTQHPLSWSSSRISRVPLESLQSLELLIRNVVYVRTAGTAWRGGTVRTDRYLARSGCWNLLTQDWVCRRPSPRKDASRTTQI